MNEQARSAGASIAGAALVFVGVIGGAVLLGVALAVVGFTAHGLYSWLCGLWGI